MGIMRTLRKLGSAVVRTVVMLYVAFCVCGSIKICLCDPDPDNCGEHCHDCTEHSEDECCHFSVDVDDFMVPHTEITLQSIPIMAYEASPIVIWEFAVLPKLNPTSTAPPDSSGNRYISYSTRIYPLA